MTSKNKLCVIIPARNEEQAIGETLDGLMKQSFKPCKIIVVDDGSTDRTADIAKQYNVQLIQLPDRGFEAVGKPALASVINAGLKNAKDMDYICILGAEHQLPPNYFQEIIDRMETNHNLVIASGAIQGERSSPDFPWGSGRIIKARFFHEIGFQFPVEYGWEDWIVYKAKQLGFETRCFSDIVSKTKRPMSFRNKGEIMYALGYDWKYALGRCLRTLMRNPKTGLNMLKGWLFHKGVKRLDDVADWVNQYQKKIFWQKAKNLLGGF
ncbi:MAG: glycosyltransferase family 2 protein [Candidatus Bathyarchaeia archaeon]